MSTIEAYAQEAQLRATATACAHALLELVDPAEKFRAELRAHAIASSRILNLYPLDLQACIIAFTHVLEDQALQGPISDLLSERQFETAVDSLPQSLSSQMRLTLVRAGLDDNAKWTGAFNAAAGRIDVNWLAYQFGHLLAFATAVAYTPDLTPEFFLPGGWKPQQENYDSAWLVLSKWVEESADVTRKLQAATSLAQA